MILSQREPEAAFLNILRSCNEQGRATRGWINLSFQPVRDDLNSRLDLLLITNHPKARTCAAKLQRNSLLTVNI